MSFGLDEFRVVQPIALPHWNICFSCLPESIAQGPSWHNGNSQHASALKRILGSFILNARSDHGEIIRLNHLIFEGFSQWFIVWNITFKCTINLMNGKKLELPKLSESDLDIIVGTFFHDSLFCITWFWSWTTLTTKWLSIPSFVQLLNLLLQKSLGERINRLSLGYTNMCTVTRISMV